MNAPTRLAHLQHVRDALASVKEYTAAGRDAFFASKMVQDAVGDALAPSKPPTLLPEPRLEKTSRSAGRPTSLATRHFCAPK